MEKLLEQAKKFLYENPYFNEVDLSDGINMIKVVRNSAVIWYYNNTEPYKTTFYPTIPTQ